MLAAHLTTAPATRRRRPPVRGGLPSAVEGAVPTRNGALCFFVRWAIARSRWGSRLGFLLVGVLVCFLIYTFYSVVGGWTIADIQERRGFPAPFLR
ncbi:hypothetical protein DWG20_01470 [Crenobacter cavernae]|uniref:Uncharacterized protein n=1 Tax=Crenobacter cavernae TaxID=2290923 RepID=A0A345Y2Q6_9NEIS|nr:hypothetical protein DWG20_01470 [Crenobacter cavernae]